MILVIITRFLPCSTHLDRRDSNGVTVYHSNNRTWHHHQAAYEVSPGEGGDTGGNTTRYLIPPSKVIACVDECAYHLCGIVSKNTVSGGAIIPRFRGHAKPGNLKAAINRSPSSPAFWPHVYEQLNRGLVFSSYYFALLLFIFLFFVLFRGNAGIQEADGKLF